VLYFSSKQEEKMSSTDKIISVGFNNYVMVDKIVAITSVNTIPIKKMIKKAKEEEKVIDASMGKKVKAAIFFISGQIVLSALAPQTLYQRLSGEEG